MDHERVNFRNSGISCGVGDLSRLSDEVEENLFAIATQLYHPARGNPKAFIIFSNVDDKTTNGHRLSTAITQQGFGSIWKSPREINPNTGNPICVWVWTIAHEPFRNWYKAQRIAKLKK